jgi:predicted AAA+ superfamily ATPase
MMLQRIREAFGARSEKAVYLPADHIWFSSHDMLDAVEFFHTHGYTHLFIDEIHHLPEWSKVVKTITDSYPRMNVAYSGSSILKLSKGHADLSRRQAVYCLKGLSFREFLSFEGVIDESALRLEDIVANHRAIAGAVCDKVKILPLFTKYLSFGYYPFYRDVRGKFPDRLVNVVNSVLDVDFPAMEDVTAATIRKAKKMLMVLSASCPQQPNMAALYRELETNRNLGIKMLDLLERAELVFALEAGSPKLKRLSSPEKLFLGDTNLMYALVSNPDPGAIRETFFANQIRASGHDVEAPGQGDFMVDGRLLFEIGGAKKRFTQIKDIEGSFVASDGIELGIGNRIPLWLFGFLY